MDQIIELLSNEIIALCVIVILPIVPSIILFRFLKTNATVKGKAFESGPFKGLQYDISGAGALYFLVLLVCVYSISLKPRREDVEIWKFKANVGLDSRYSPRRIRDIVAYVSHPKEFTIEEDGSFHMQLLIHRKADGSLEFPSILFQLDTLSRVVQLDTASSMFTKNYKKEIVSNTIEIVDEKVILGSNKD